MQTKPAIANQMDHPVCVGCSDWDNPVYRSLIIPPSNGNEEKDRGFYRFGVCNPCAVSVTIASEFPRTDKIIRVIAAAIIRLYLIYYAIDTNEDPLLNIVWAAMITTVQIDYGIISSNLLCLKPLVTPFKKTLMFTTGGGSIPVLDSANSKQVLCVQRSMQLDDMPDFAWPTTDDHQP